MIIVDWWSINSLIRWFISSCWVHFHKWTHLLWNELLSSMDTRGKDPFLKGTISSIALVYWIPCFSTYWVVRCINSLLAGVRAFVRRVYWCGGCATRAHFEEHGGLHLSSVREEHERQAHQAPSKTAGKLEVSNFISCIKNMNTFFFEYETKGRDYSKS